MTFSPQQSAHLPRAISLNQKPHLALITGGSRGIGRAIAEEFVKNGIEVLVPSRTELDLNSSASIHSYSKSILDRPVDILVNNAGINKLNSIDQINPEDWAEMIQINLTAPQLLIQHFSTSMKKLGWGRILNISSIFGIVTKERRGAYSATKAGINGLTRTAAVELGVSGILVNSVCPGYIDTELTRKNNSPTDIAVIEKSIPLQRMAIPSEIAQLAFYLCSEMNSYLTGQNIVIDGGFTCR